MIYVYLIKISNLEVVESLNHVTGCLSVLYAVQYGLVFFQVKTAVCLEVRNRNQPYH